MQLFASPAQQIQGTPGTNPRRWGETWPPQWSAFDARFEKTDATDAMRPRNGASMSAGFAKRKRRGRILWIFFSGPKTGPSHSPTRLEARQEMLRHWREHLGAQWWWTPAEKDILVHQMLEIAYFKQTQGIPRDSRMQAWVKNYIEEWYYVIQSWGSIFFGPISDHLNL